jgi:hypothetical protein
MNRSIETRRNTDTAFTVDQRIDDVLEVADRKIRHLADGNQPQR